MSEFGGDLELGNGVEDVIDAQVRLSIQDRREQVPALDANGVQRLQLIVPNRRRPNRRETPVGRVLSGWKMFLLSLAIARGVLSDLSTRLLAGGLNAFVLFGTCLTCRRRRLIVPNRREPPAVGRLSWWQMFLLVLAIALVIFFDILTRLLAGLNVYVLLGSFIACLFIFFSKAPTPLSTTIFWIIVFLVYTISALRIKFAPQP